MSHHIKRQDMQPILTHAATALNHMVPNMPHVERTLRQLDDARARPTSHGSTPDGPRNQDHSDPTSAAALARHEPNHDHDRYLDLIATINTAVDQMWIMHEIHQPKARPVTDQTTAWCENERYQHKSPVKRDKMKTITTPAGKKLRVCSSCASQWHKKKTLRTPSDTARKSVAA